MRNIFRLTVAFLLLGVLTACGGGGGGGSLAVATPVTTTTMTATVTTVTPMTVTTADIASSTVVSPVTTTADVVSTVTNTITTASDFSFTDFRTVTNTSVTSTVVLPSTVSYIISVTLTVSSTVFMTTILSATVSLAAANTITGSYDTTALEFTRNYGLAQIGAHKAYERGYFGQGVTVGVVDTGVHTTHIDLTANLVPGRRADSSGNLYTEINDANGHGTYVAGVIAAAANDTLAQGVAPQASIMPLQMGNTTNGDLDGNELALFRHAVANSVHIVNNSWGPQNIVEGTYEGDEYWAEIPLLGPLLEYYGSGLIYNFSVIIATINSADMAFVWAAGNDYWHEGAGVQIENTDTGNSRSITKSDFINGFIEISGNNTIVYSTLDIDHNDPGGYALVPIYEPSLLGRWTHAVAVGSNSVIAGFSNGCGRATKYWCLAAPGVSIYTTSNGTNNDSDTTIRRVSGTSFAAPHVSGALAVLKSRLPNMPMSVVLALLFHTATDLGREGIDDVYGHGLVNLEKAITVQGDVGFAASFTAQTVSSLTAFVTVFSTLYFIVGVPVTVGDYYTVTILAANATTGYTPSAEFTLDYGLAQINADKAYERGYFGQEVTVAIFGAGMRTSHIDLTANLLPGKNYSYSHVITTAITDDSPSYSFIRNNGNDTFAAGVIGADVNNTLAHGVAPSVKILPLKGGGTWNGRPYLSIGGALIAAFRLAATSSVHILYNGWNHDWGQRNSGSREVVYFPPLSGLPGLEKLEAFPISFPPDELINNFSQISAAITTADMALVWATGDHGWNTETGEIKTARYLRLISIISFLDSFSYSYVSDTMTLSTTVGTTISTTVGTTISLSTVDISTTISLATMSLDPNFAGGYALAPVYEPSLLGRWAHAVAVDSNSVIASFSNGCGRDTKYWCLAAPGVSLTGLSRDSDTATTTNDGSTAYSAAYVSGALAVLKSRLPTMPMSVILALLFETATDLGVNGVADGVDDVYGHGLLNLEKAITVQGEVALAPAVLYSTTAVTFFATVFSTLTTSFDATATITSTVNSVFTMTSAVSSTTFMTTAMTMTSSTSMTTFMTTFMTNTVSSAAANNNNLLQSGVKVSPLLAALKEQLSGVSAAVQFLPGYYYNTPLAALVEVSEVSDSNLGKAASNMLSKTTNQGMGYGFAVVQSEGTILGVEHETRLWRLNYDICASCDTSLWEGYQNTDIAKPFFATNRQGMSFAAKLGGEGAVEIFAATGIQDDTTADDIDYRQYGFRFNLDIPTLEFGNETKSAPPVNILELSRTTEKGSLYGGEYTGAFALEGSETYQGRLHTERTLTDNWRGMASYQFGWTDSKAQSGGLIADISRLRFDGYRLGVEGTSLFGVPFANDGVMRFGITRQSGISSGTIRLRYGVATTSEFIEDYQYSLNNGYEVVEREFSLATEPTTQYHWGYLFAPRDNLQAAFGLEHDSSINESVASLVLRWSY